MLAPPLPLCQAHGSPISWSTSRWLSSFTSLLVGIRVLGWQPLCDHISQYCLANIKGLQLLAFLWVSYNLRKKTQRNSSWNDLEFALPHTAVWAWHLCGLTGGRSPDGDTCLSTGEAAALPTLHPPPPTGQAQSQALGWSAFRASSLPCSSTFTPTLQLPSTTKKSIPSYTLNEGFGVCFSCMHLLPNSKSSFKITCPRVQT